MNDPQVDCLTCAWRGKLSETNSADLGQDQEDVPICPDCFVNEEISPVAFPVSAGAARE